MLLISIFFVNGLLAKEIKVSSQASFDNAIRAALPNDEIVWMTGMYSDIFMNVTKSNMTIKAKVAGRTIFTGKSRVNVDGSHVKLIGFQFLNGNIEGKNVIQTKGSDNLFAQINIARYTSGKYLVIKEQCQRVKVSYCNFENRLNLHDRNIVSVLVNENQPGFHKIEYSSFKNFKGKGGDMGIEPIRIGVSTQKEYSSKSIVEYCYFTQCNGDGEIISNKAADNVIRYNTFINNPVSELVLRHGDRASVYGNFFLNGKGGVRIKEGEHHAVFNNYFSGLKDRSIIVQSTKEDPVRNVVIAHNTFVKTGGVKLGGSKSDYEPKKIDVINNIFVDPVKSWILNPTGSEVFLGNMYLGNLGVSSLKGMKRVDTLLEKNKAGFYQISSNSPAINASVSNLLHIPKNKGVSADETLVYDILKMNRPKSASQKDVGCWEFKQGGEVIPHVSKFNTGPRYLKKP